MGYLNYYYVRKNDLDKERLFVDLCVKKRIHRSNLINQWRDRWLKENAPRPPRRVDNIPALEAYLTSEKDRLKARSKKLDEEWRSRKK